MVSVFDLQEKNRLSCSGAENLSSLSEADLEQFDKLLSAETPVLLKMLLGQVPDEVI